jgi:hypothetical protein
MPEEFTEAIQPVNGHITETETPSPETAQTVVKTPRDPAVDRRNGKRIHELLGKNRQLKDANAQLEARVSDLAGRNEFLESRHAENRLQVEGLLGKLAAYENAEADLAQQAADQLKKTLALFENRSIATRQKFSDYDVVIQTRPELRRDVLQAVVEMSAGPQTLYFLIKSPDFCRQLHNLPLGAALEQIYGFVQQTEQSLLSANVAKKYMEVARR